MREIVIAMPSLMNSQCVEGRDSAIMTDRLLIRNEINPLWIGLGGDPYLAKVRSKLATIFIEDFPHAEALFFIDDDISWPAQKVLEFLDSDKPVIAGVYPQKMDALKFPCSLLGDRETGAIIEEDGLWAASMAPTGFLCIKRWAVQAIYDRSRRFVSIDDRDTSKTRIYREVFKMGVREDMGEWIGEDPWFCQEWISLGGEIWIDPDIEFTHRGSKKWSARMIGNLGEQSTSQSAAGEFA